MSKLEIIYVLEVIGLAGGIKNVLEQANRLHDAGMKVQVFALDQHPNWYPLKVPVRSFPNYPAMLKELKQINAIKIATWWKTLPTVWYSCDPNQGGTGVPLYLVQDIEESYYPQSPEMQARVLETYRAPVNILTIANWTTNQLLERFQKQATNISIAVDQDIYKPNRTHDYDPFRVLACSRKSQHLKGFQVTVQAMKLVMRHVRQASMVTFGTERPHLFGIPTMHFSHQDDPGVAYLYANCGVFVQTSMHEGFGLPILEAMACGAPVVTTKAEGNEEFCKDGWNCVLVEKGDIEAVARGIIRVLTDRGFAEYIAKNGLETAKTYNWTEVMHRLQHTLRQFGA
ncbi:glycosyltransferase family 4 protein [Paenibacillus guangzhouensis]|uniref:glycosyltransferase family 4 protein n=1 Tax=Paenibacillus guangzhouensis TaxID=1473112 RepID=UPI0012672D18|nr:glycosyltransferase family 4 protein [Paenibacillus guangzhouensis]